MTGRDYSAVLPTMWRNPKFTRLDTDGRLLLLYFQTSPHVNSAGCSCIPESYAAHDLGWTVERYAKSRQDLIDAGLISFDGATDEAYVERWFSIQPNAPKNPKHADGTRKRISAIESDAIRERVEEQFSDTKYGGMSPEQLVSESADPLLNTGFMRGRR